MGRITQDNSKKEYFRAQRINPTGNYTEYIVRTYYLIYKVCRESSLPYCPKASLNIRAMSASVYDGIYDKPDHDYYNVITGCMKDLEKTGYISIQQMDGIDYIWIQKPLDFLKEGEHKHYLKKYGITESTPVSEIIFSPIDSPQELQDALNHAFYPDKYPDPLDKIIKADKKNNNMCLSTHCDRCGGQYVHRNGKFGPFFGCSNYPRCKNTKSIADLSYMILQQNGINIYEIDHMCWKCKRAIKLRSYFPHIDIMLADPMFTQYYDLKLIRLSLTEGLDNYLSQQYPEICVKSSKKAGFDYMANTCPHCNSLQGSQMSLDVMFEKLLSQVNSEKIGTCIVDNIKPIENVLPQSDWQVIIKEVLKYQ